MGTCVSLTFVDSTLPSGAFCWFAVMSIPPSPTKDCWVVVVATVGCADALVDVIAFEKRGCVGAENKLEVVWAVVLSDKREGALVEVAIVVETGCPKLNDGGGAVVVAVETELVGWPNEMPNEGTCADGCCCCCCEVPNEREGCCEVPNVGGLFVVWTVGWTAWTCVVEVNPKPNEGALVGWGCDPKENPVAAGLAIDGVVDAPNENPVVPALKTRLQSFNGHLLKHYLVVAVTPPNENPVLALKCNNSWKIQ